MKRGVTHCRGHSIITGPVRQRGLMNPLNTIVASLQQQLFLPFGGHRSHCCGGPPVNTVRCCDSRGCIPIPGSEITVHDAFIQRGGIKGIHRCDFH